MDRVILEIRSGRSGGERFVIAPGGELRVGRTERAGVVLSDDAEMSAVHFSITWSGTRAVLTDAQSIRGTTLNGQHLETGFLANGDWIRAGATDFSIYFEGSTPAPGGEPTLTPAQDDALSGLAAEPQPLFALVDAARDPRILTLLRESVDPQRSLYEGAAARPMDEWAPYLVELTSDSELLDRLVAEGWGKRWASYLTSPRPFRELRSHLRRFLMVMDEETGKEMYFRYYDPAVLRVFLRAAGQRQRESLFGKAIISSFLGEGERGELLRFEAP